MKKIERNCPECKAGMTEIRVVIGSTMSGVQIVGLDYILDGAKKSLWTGTYPAAGKLHALMCPDCGRVLWYGDRDSDQFPLPAGEPESMQASLPIPSDDA